MKSIPDFLIENVDLTKYGILTMPNNEHSVLKYKYDYIRKNRELFDDSEIAISDDFEQSLYKCQDKLDVLQLIDTYYNQRKSFSFYADSNICHQISGKETVLGKSISKTMLRVAATRIFSDPEQSIMELPSNSIDSYNPRYTIGKFGFGFLSFLYWLCETKDGKYQRQIIIKTSYRGERNKTKSYAAEMIWTKKGLKINISLCKIPTFSTKIELKCNEFNLSEHNMKMFSEYVMKLKHVKNVKISLNSKLLNKGSEAIRNKNISITLTESLIAIKDSAGGIPFSIFLKNMLIPSSSSKERIEQVFSHKKEEIHDNNSEYKLSIILAGIEIKSVSLIDPNSKLHTQHYIIHLPPGSKLPVSREDIIYEYESEEISHFMKSMENILFKLIEQNTHGIYNFISLVKLYIKGNKSPSLSESVYKLLNEIKTFPYMFVPNTPFWREFIKIERISNEFILFDDSLMFDAELKFLDHLDKFPHDKNVFKSKIVVALENDFRHYKFSENGGFSSIVFVKNLSELDYSKAVFSNKSSLLIKKSSRLQASPMILSNSEEQKYVDLLFMALNKKYLSLRDNVILRKCESFVIYMRLIFYDDFEYYILMLANYTKRISDVKITPVYGKIATYNISGNFYASSWERDYDLSYRNIGKFIRVTYIDKLLSEFYIDCYSVNVTDFVKEPCLENFIFYCKCENMIDELIYMMPMSPGKGEVFILNIIICELMDDNFSFSQTDIITGICSFILSEIRKTMDNLTLEDLLKKHYRYDSSSIRTFLVNKLITPILYSSKKYLTFLNTSLREKILENEEIEFLFSCKCLIVHAFNNDVIDYTKLVDEYKTFSPSSLSLQTLEITVNEGTTKEYGKALITELVQNALDATRSNPNVDQRIDVEIGVNFISVSDNVGISSIENILIPFLSSKNPNDPNVTGEMGTGFFNVYRQPFTEYVTIETVYNGRHFLIKGTPVVDDKGYVTDILYNFRLLDGQENSFTTITIFLKNDIKMISSVTIDAQLYVSEQLSFINEVEIYLNDTLVSSENILIKEIDNFGAFYFSESKSLPSYIYTNGIPLMKLTDLKILNNDPELLEFIELYGLNGFSVNLYKSAYDPTQARTDIKFKDGNDVKFLSYIKSAIIEYIFIMYIEDRVNDPNEIIENSTSCMDIEQVNTNVENYFTTFVFNYRYMDFSPKLSVLKVIQKLIVKIKFDNTIELSDLPRKTLLDKVIFHWIKYKPFRDIESRGSNKSHQKKENLRRAISENVDELSTFNLVYWEILKEMYKNKDIDHLVSNSYPVVVFQEMESLELHGYFKSSVNKIFLNYRIYNPDKFRTNLRLLDNGESFDVEEMVNGTYLMDYFSTSEPLCVYIHELTHALLNHAYAFEEECPHSNVNITINGKHGLSFYDAGLEIYITAAVKYDLMERYHEKLKKSLWCV